MCVYLPSSKSQQSIGTWHSRSVRVHDIPWSQCFAVHSLASRNYLLAVYHTWRVSKSCSWMFEVTPFDQAISPKSPTAGKSSKAQWHQQMASTQLGSPQEKKNCLSAAPGMHRMASINIKPQSEEKPASGRQLTDGLGGSLSKSGL